MLIEQVLGLFSDIVESTVTETIDQKADEIIEVLSAWREDIAYFGY